MKLAVIGTKVCRRSGTESSFYYMPMMPNSYSDASKKAREHFKKEGFDIYAVEVKTL